MFDLRVHDLCFGECPLMGPSLYLWVQGCPRRCRGCFNQSALDEDGPARAMSAEEVEAEWEAVDGAGLVLSGGEPFAQASALARVCALVRRRRPDTPVVTYTGYQLGELLTGGRHDWLDLLHATDVLIDGPYLQARQTDLPLVGSDNQRVLFLSQRIPPDRLARLHAEPFQMEARPGRCVRLVGTGSREIGLHALIHRLRTQGVILEA